MATARRQHGTLLNGQFIKSLRARRGNTLSEAAKKIGIDRRVLSKAEQGGSVDQMTAEYIATYYRVELTSILAVTHFAGPSTAVIIASHADVVSKNIDIIANANKHIVCFGSRSRDQRYLMTIEEACKKNQALVYRRILFFKPFHQELQDHLLRILDIRSPIDRSKGRQTLYISVCDDVLKQPELSICMNEKNANFILPSISEPGNYDTSLFIDDIRIIDGWTNLAHDLCRNHRPIETKDDILKLGTIPHGGRYV
jgi:transcriptional regulator with XRE-family HTH domain